jgi:protein N-lysine methyltransferase METTL21D
VIATDVPDVISTVLNVNISNNLPNLPPASGRIQVRELDWTISPDKWTWDDQHIIASSRIQSSSSHQVEDLLKPPFDFIITSDTLYHPDLVQPLFRSIHALSIASSSLTSRSPVVYLCVERRDPTLIDRAFLEARETWGFKTERIAHKKLVKVIEKADIKWDKEDWEDIEVWKLLSTHMTRDLS